ncbi:MAG: carotenoid biosynthesis protein [Roseiflexaceae bacterium]|nr:carotenoid biosynthesis protein [Roseiflexaceae bacterium]
MRHMTYYLALYFLFFYVLLFPGSTLTVAFDLVPAWGAGFGSVLLLLQGGAMLAWLNWRYGGRGLIAGALIAALGFAVEYLGETSGFPFGRYRYTELIQPKLLGVVPLPITAAWMMTAAAAFEIARRLVPPSWGARGVMLVTATLVLLLDLQIETVAALISNYWVWLDSGPYYGVPTENFIAWWLVGVVMAGVLWRLLGNRMPSLRPLAVGSAHIPRFAAQVMPHVPVALYLLSTAMFTTVNLARGYSLAGTIGLAVLIVAGALIGRFGEVEWRQTKHRQYD